MKKQSIFAVTLVLLSCAALAGVPDTVHRLKPNLKAVVKTGDVRPVNGITAASQPDKAALRVFADQGYSTVIDLRTEGENRGFKEREFIESLGMNYIAMPIGGSDEINFDNARKLDELINQAEGPILIHCASGNRVGALLALRESLNGADDMSALRFGVEGGVTRLTLRVIDLLEEE